MAIVCGNVNCKYHKSVFCGKDIVMLNGYCQCEVWWDKNGQVRPVPFYNDEAESEVPKSVNPAESEE